MSTRAFKLGETYNKTATVQALEVSNTVLHIAGVNRGAESEVYGGNIVFAEQLSESLLACKTPPSSVVFANSIQANNGSIYGEAKLRASQILAETAAKIGISFVNVLIPNVFGEHGRPFYNAVTSTFCHQIASGDTPSVDADNDLVLVHAQDVADRLLQHTSQTEFERTFSSSSVVALRDSIVDLASIYSNGDIPDLGDPFRRNLFNTYRSYKFEINPVIKLKRNSDSRGAFFEIVRSHGGQGQSSFSTTVPAVTRGDHFHRRKVERFTVLSGEGTIRLRKLFSDNVVEFAVNGTAPSAIDMPTLWTHSITNTGDSELLTSFWISEIYDSTKPDTVAERVLQ